VTVPCRGRGDAPRRKRRRQPTLREYVRSCDLAECIEEWVNAKPEERSYSLLADAAGVSTRAINKVLTATPYVQTIFLADKLMTAMDRHVIELDTVKLAIRKDMRPDDWKNVPFAPAVNIDQPAAA